MSASEIATPTRSAAQSRVADRPTVRRTPPRAKPRKDRAGYLFLLPWFAGMLFTIVPFFASLYLAFTEYHFITPPEWIGLENFREMLGDKKLHNALKVTFTYTFISVPLSLTVALGVALALHRGIRGLSIYRAAFYLPSLLGGSVAIVLLWGYLFGLDGVVNRFLGWFGIQGPGWTSDPRFSLTTLILLHLWTFGAPMVIFLAGLRQIPVVYYEAAAIDGAGRFHRFRHVTLPLLSPIIFFNLIMSLIGSFQTFTQAFIMSGGSGAPADSLLFYNLYLYQRGFTQFDMGYAAAMAWVLLVIIAAFTAMNFLAAKYWVFYES